MVFLRFSQKLLKMGKQLNKSGLKKINMDLVWVRPEKMLNQSQSKKESVIYYYKDALFHKKNVESLVVVQKDEGEILDQKDDKKTEKSPEKIDRTEKRIVNVDRNQVIF